MAKTAYIVTGEPSGDILASRLMQSLVKLHPDMQFAGMGGETMTALGFKSLFNISEISVMGFWEVVPKLPLIMKRMRQVVADIERLQPDVIVTVDSWGFVSLLLNSLKKRSIAIPKVHYVAPQVWAWKKGRAKKTARLLDRLMALWPYEPPYFEKYGLKCDFVGHPVIENTADLNDDLAEFKRQHGIPQQGTFLCVLPGSRRNEIRKLIPVFKKVVARLSQDFPDLFLIIPSVAAIAGEVREAFADVQLPHSVVLGQRERYNAFRACHFAIAASGTVTLELAALRTPHVIAYTFSPITNWLADKLVKSKYANLINIMADKFVIPEFVLGNCRDDLIYQAAADSMKHPDKAQARVEEALKYFSNLKPEGMMPSEKAAAVVSEMMRHE
ncbi:MAG: lipid-A-disaccharide synthase [Prevotellaceae bacterium]|jgi:lipid-A-disaccharide synthase|nr:lipid-A-disaccharide synthase [Prevotellaceae bacterium]